MCVPAQAQASGMTSASGRRIGRDALGEDWPQRWHACFGALSAFLVRAASDTFAYAQLIEIGPSTCHTVSRIRPAEAAYRRACRCLQHDRVQGQEFPAGPVGAAAREQRRAARSWCSEAAGGSGPPRVRNGLLSGRLVASGLRLPLSRLVSLRRFVGSRNRPLAALARAGQKSFPAAGHPFLVPAAPALSLPSSPLGNILASPGRPA
jgi:hypothetical protein